MLHHPFVDVTSGLPQGSVLGPLLFLIYIDSLAELSLHSSKLQLFADDALMCRTVQNSSNAEDLQADINLFAQWIANNNLKLNIKKCKSL